MEAANYKVFKLSGESVKVSHLSDSEFEQFKKENEGKLIFFNNAPLGQSDFPKKEQTVEEIEYWERVNKSSQSIEKEDVMASAILNHVKASVHFNNEYLMFFSDFFKLKDLIKNIANELLQKNSKKFAVPDQNTSNISTLWKQLTWYFNNGLDDSYELNKGIFLFGEKDLGKSFMFRVFNTFLSSLEKLGRKNKNGVFNIISSIELVYECKKNNGIPEKFLKGEWLIDDIGAEPTEQVNYGNRQIFMADYIFRRHQLWEKSGIRTHFTSNLSIEQIESTYGDRTSDRIFRMCNIMVVLGSGFTSKN